jgi:ribose 5-phosphate isomerase B
MKFVIASDHAGVEYKAVLLKEIRENGFEITDLGTNDAESSDDYPDHAADVANAIIANMADRGIIICGSGVGVSIAANKFKGIRAGVCHDTYSAHQCVEHDNANVLCLGERVVGIELVREIVFAFLNAQFTRVERHQRRLDKISAIENKNMK